MKKALVLTVVTVLLTAYSSLAKRVSTPRHTLFTPQSYHVGSMESFSFTSYSSKQFEVTATVSYDQCSCHNHWRRRQCNNKGDVLSTARGTTRLGRPVILDVQMPQLSELQGRNYFISVTSHNGSVQYLHRRQVSFSFNSFGFLLVKTDKPIYKPEQEVNFCVVYVDKNMKPFRDSANVTIRVRDAKFKQILKFDSVIIQGDGDFACLNFTLSDEVNYGTWQIKTNLKVPREQGGCHEFYKTPSTTCTFKVKEFTLPRFEVILEGPKQLNREEEFITGRVIAKYTFGERLQGTVKVNATLETSSRRKSFLFYERIAMLVNGTFKFRISSNYHEVVKYNYDPFCVNSQVFITAEVEETGRGTKQSDIISFPLVANPVRVKLADDNPQLFHPGINYTLKAVVTSADGSPSPGFSIRVTATMNNGQRPLVDSDTTSTGEDGRVTVIIPVPSNANCLKINLRLSNSSQSCGNEQVCIYPAPMYSPTKSFLQLEDVSRRSPLTVGSKAKIQANSTVSFSILHLLVISQGSIQEHTFKRKHNGTTSAMVSFRVTAPMVPRVKVLGVFSREDGELVADIIEIPVECALPNQVGVAFNRSSAPPGEPIGIETVTSPHSMVVLSIIDKSLTLRADACKSLESDNVCSLIRSLTRGSLPGVTKCNTRSCCLRSCSEPHKYGVSTVFNAAGVSLQSNMFQPSPPYRLPYRPIWFPWAQPVGGDFNRLRYYSPVPQLELSSVIPGPTSARPVVGGNPVEEGGRARIFFPETWIWAVQRTDENGTARLTSTVPDTITTWVAEAFALSRDSGLGLSPRVELTASKPFFVSLELPFSVNFGETVIVTPLLFYFGSRRRVNATVSLAVDDDLDIIDDGLHESGMLNISRGTSTPFNLRLRPRAIGQLAITVSAVGDHGEKDVVRKFLNVKPGCERFEVTQNLFVEDSGQHCFNYTLLSCVIPGSAKATITITGDVMSPPNLGRLLVLPSGCGEQNLVRTATNWVVAEYLKTTDQLQDFIAVKIRNNVHTGYQRQLTYLKGSGCFSIWSHTGCNVWLTAAVVNTFCGIVSFYKEQEPGSELIDKVVIDGALNYMIHKQRRSGKLPITGRVHNFGLLQDKGYIAHTAFGLLSLKQYVETFEDDTTSTSTLINARTAISRAEQYLLRQYEKEGKFCNYGHALATYALLRHSNNPPQNTSMMDDLRSRIVTSEIFPGACFACNECPDDTRSGDSGGKGVDCIGRPRSEGSAACVETTAYALLALLEGGDTQYTVCLAQWLVRIRSGSGGYWSSQDTVVALQALAKFAEHTYTADIDQSVVFNLPGLSSNVVRIVNSDNRFQRFGVEVPIVPSNNNCLSWSGNGTVIVQSTLEYHGCNCCSDARAFSMDLATEKEDTPLGAILELSIRIRYLRGRSSNMAIVDVEIPTGYIYTGNRFLDDFAKIPPTKRVPHILPPLKIKNESQNCLMLEMRQYRSKRFKAANGDLERVDQRGSNIIFYFSDIRNSPTTFIVEFLERFTVENPQPLPVTVYDYYDPGQTLTKYFLPSTSAVLPPIATATPPLPFPGTSSSTPIGIIPFLPGNQ